MERRAFVAAVAGAAGAQVAGRVPRAPASQRVPRRTGLDLSMDEVTIAELQSGLRDGRFTSRDLVEHYLERIAQVDRTGPTLRSVIESNPDALAIADGVDAERRNRVRGPLHGIPVLIKDNIDTGDRMKTSAGSFALADTSAPQDSGVAAKLRAAGAIIIGKTNLSEWANMRSSHSSSGWSARGGQTRNPYVLDRNPCGSSSGTGAAIAANLAVVGVGTETDGSVVCPSHQCGLVGLKPTVGLLPGDGIVPISHTQDTAGPMARTVTDAAILLTALAVSGDVDYARPLDPGALKGARLGVLRQDFGFDARVDHIMEQSLAALRDAGAVLVDPVKIPSAKKVGDPEFQVLLYELKADMAAYLARRTDQPHRTLADLIAFNTANADRELPWFGQELFERAEKKGPLSEPAYRKALAACRRYARVEGLDAAFTRHRVEALVSPTGGPAWVTDLLNGDHFGGGNSTLSAVSGYPAITVPAGFVRDLPVGVTFMGTSRGEARLLAFAYAFEQATRVRRAPAFVPTLTP